MIKSAIGNFISGLIVDIVNKPIPNKNALCVTIAGVEAPETTALPIVVGSNGLPTQIQLLNGASGDMRVNGSSTNVTFTVTAQFGLDYFVEEFFITGRDANIDMSKFLAANALTNGLLVTVKSQNKITTFSPIKRTHDLVIFSTEDKVWMSTDSSSDTIKASNTQPFVIKKQGTYGPGNDDYIKVTVRDNLSAAGIDDLQAWTRGGLR